MLPPKKLNFVRRKPVSSPSPGQDTKRPSSNAMTPHDMVTAQSEAKRTGFDWSTFNR